MSGLGIGGPDGRVECVNKPLIAQQRYTQQKNAPQGIPQQLVVGWRKGRRLIGEQGSGRQLMIKQLNVEAL